MAVGGARHIHFINGLKRKQARHQMECINFSLRPMVVRPFSSLTKPQARNYCAPGGGVTGGLSLGRPSYEKACFRLVQHLKTAANRAGRPFVQSGTSAMTLSFFSCKVAMISQRRIGRSPVTMPCTSCANCAKLVAVSPVQISTGNWQRLLQKKLGVERFCNAWCSYAYRPNENRLRLWRVVKQIMRASQTIFAQLNQRRIIMPLYWETGASPHHVGAGEALITMIIARLVCRQISANRD